MKEFEDFYEYVILAITILNVLAIIAVWRKYRSL